MKSHINTTQSLIQGGIMKRKKRILVLIVPFLAVAIFLSSAFVFGQEDYTRDEYKLRQAFKIANSLFEKGQKSFLKEDYKKAQGEFLQCLQKMPEHADAAFYMAQISYKLGNHEKALKYIEMAKENYKFIVKLKLNRQQQYFIQLQEQRGRIEQVILELRARLPRVTDAQVKERIRADIGRKEADIAILDKQLRSPVPDVEKEEQTPADYFYVHGNILFKLKNYQDAFTQYKETIKIDPGHGNAYINLANLYYMGKQYQKALDCLNSASENGAAVNPKFKDAILKALGK